MPPKPDSLYNAVPDVVPQGDVGRPIGNRASGADFGAQAWQETSKAASGAFDVAQEYAQRASEAKVNDALANKWTPEAARMRGEFDALDGYNKVKGYDTYVSGLQKYGNDILKEAKTPYERELLTSMLNKQIGQEVEVAKRAQVAALDKYEEDSHSALISSLSDNVVKNYNDPAITADTLKQIDAQVYKFGLDRGMSDLAIAEQQRKARGLTVEGMVNRALANNDIGMANAIYTQNKSYISGYQQLEMDKTLHAENLKQYSSDAVKALMNGEPLPIAGGDVAKTARIAAIRAAETSNVPVNQALTVLRLETSDGTNLGKRGDIGQTGKGGDINQQAKNMTDALAKAKETATDTLGRVAEDWEAYVVYQQGVAGGPALLNAASDPTKKAIDAIAPFYSPKDAISAIVDNGGNATMSAGQFLDFLKKKYTDTSKRVMLDLPTVDSQKPAVVSDAVNPSENGTILGKPLPSLADAEDNDKGGIAVQPGATPIQSLQNFNEVYPDLLQRANSIPNIQQREAVLGALKHQHSVYAEAANAWKSNFLNKAQELGADPNFTDVSQIPPDMMAALSDSPTTFTYLERRAEYNLKKTAGSVTGDMKTYGQGFPDAIRSVWEGRITSQEQVHDLYNKGALTISGHDKLLEQMKGDKTPENASESKMKNEFFNMAKSRIMLPGMSAEYDPEGAQRYLNFMTEAMAAYDAGRAKGMTPAQLLNSSSKDYIGNSISNFQRSAAQLQRDAVLRPAVEKRTLRAIVSDVKLGKLTEAQGKEEAIRLGLIAAPPPPVVPRPE